MTAERRREAQVREQVDDLGVRCPCRSDCSDTSFVFQSTGSVAGGQ